MLTWASELNSPKLNSLDLNSSSAAFSSSLTQLSLSTSFCSKRNSMFEFL